MTREASIAERVAKGVVSRDIDYYEEIQRFIKAFAYLEYVIDLWQSRWSYGHMPDDVLEDMGKFSSKMAGEARKIKLELDRKIDEWQARTK